jgi:NitT/TauT family transport system substrate-binding protein
MSGQLKKTILVVIALFGALTFAHFYTNVGFKNVGGSSTGGADTDRFRVGFLPVTCHLTCPVTDWINKSIAGAGFYEPIRFSGWPELKESFLSGQTKATFILAPLAMILKEQGTPIKIVYLGHRDGTAIMVHKDSGIIER